MTREADIVRSLVEMADTLVDDCDVVANRAGGPVRRPARRLRRGGDAGLSPGQPGTGGLLQRGDAAAGAVRAAGPGRPLPGRVPTGERVEHENLEAGSGRWPSFAAAALQAGFRSALALPLRLREATLGALNLLSATQTPMGEADVIVARAFADLASASSSIVRPPKPSA